MIQTINLTKRYGKLVALDNLHLNIEDGECFGYIGPNGAGKTTTIKILATLLQPTWGEARVCGYVVGYESRKIRPLIGYVPDFFGAYEDMVVQEYLEFFASAYGITGKQRERVVGDVLELTDLSYKKDALVDSLSRGMQQRLSIARVLLHDPRVLLLDEPASGLDPRARIEIRELLKELRRMGKTILISSHILPELADLCTTVGILEQGKLLYHGPIKDIIARAKTGTKVCVAVTDQQDLAAMLLEKTNGVKAVEQRDGHLIVELERTTHDFTGLARLLLDNNFRIKEIKEEEVNLETAFMRLTKGMVQ
ncbi:MAG: ABC transporter ATP-binding protein [Phycisphaerae bacterium]|nr:MAG: ABC transporter ATP-binding protein [Planctomycetota bacterium]KAB2949985.1 MAG: ABC transporter ATP-binding protein [Phycisphaerae bacterium]MBE7458605.1 ABC transporter ATP-binding protein [Planctomycetia bacterium]MCK6465062.1 ABC transporter ATP-binding protein [Phycisphaerae bacterium]MCL4718640.1 ABC transporter ATP-binding protein [Phycisphaerae bacterium]